MPSLTSSSPRQQWLIIFEKSLDAAKTDLIWSIEQRFEERGSEERIVHRRRRLAGDPYGTIKQTSDPWASIRGKETSGH